MIDSNNYCWIRLTGACSHCGKYRNPWRIPQNVIHKELIHKRLINNENQINQKWTLIVTDTTSTAQSSPEKMGLFLKSKICFVFIIFFNHLTRSKKIKPLRCKSLLSSSKTERIMLRKKRIQRDSRLQLWLLLIVSYFVVDRKWRSWKRITHITNVKDENRIYASS